MTNQIISVPVTLQIQEDVAKIIARAEFEGVYSSKNGDLRLQELERNNITPETLAEYFMQLQVLVCAFAEDLRTIGNGALKEFGFRFSELKNLWMPSITATILSQVGDCQIGNYRLEVCVPADGKVDRKFVIEMSENLYNCAHLLYANKDQIGVAQKVINPDFMANIVVAMDSSARSAEVRCKDGSNPDIRMKMLATLSGLVLVNSAYQILYPVVDYVTYGRPAEVLNIDDVAER